MSFAITDLTKDCAREDCRIVSHGSTSTCMGWLTAYDKQGKRIQSEDPNIYTSSFACGACGKSWTVKAQGDRITTTAY